MMDAEAKLGVVAFVNDVALLGARMVHVFYNCVSLERNLNHRIERVRHLNAAVQTLGRLVELVKGQANDNCVLDDQAFIYVETLADECAIALGRTNWILTGDRVWRHVHAPRYWKSVSFVNSKGQKELLKLEVDEMALYKGLKSSNGDGKLGQIRGTSNRFKELQLHLLLVVQVIAMHSMTKELSAGIDELRIFVEHQNYIGRAAKLAGLCDRDGKVLRRKIRKIYISPSSGSVSESEIEIINRRPHPPLGPRCKPLSGRPLPPLPPGWIGPLPGQGSRRPHPPPPPPPGWRGSSVPFPPKIVDSAPPESAFEKRTPPQIETLATAFVGPGPPPALRIVVAEDRETEHQPPSYTEKERGTIPNGSERKAPVPLANNEQKDSKRWDAKVPDQAEAEGSSRTSTVNKSIEQSTDNNALILSPKSSGFGMKFKSLFRTKASLEAEMKQTLANANASLTAFVIQEGDFRKVPHSAFHSLEYTHMRTILSQLKDNAWFKTFSDLTKTEHKTLDVVLCKSMQDGKWMQRELVVLKVLQQNRFNAWLRVIEECIGAEESGFGYRYENGRIILAIVREKQCENFKALVSPTLLMPPMPLSPKVIDRTDQLPAAPVPDLLPFMPRDGKIISDLSKIGTLSISQNGNTPAGAFRGPHYGYRPPPPPNSSHWESSPCSLSAPVESSLASDSGPKKIPLKAVSEHSARRALTSYTAFTFRPAPPENTVITPLVHIPAITWARCSLSREHETKADLLKRIEHFKRGGISIIDMKLRLREDQSAQVTRLVEELNYIEKDEKFEHTLVELSMIEVANGSVTKPTPAVYIDIIHVIVQRAPRDSTRCADTYNKIMNPLSSPPGHPAFGVVAQIPPNNSREIRDDVVVIHDFPRRTKGRKGRRSVASSVTYTSCSSGSGSDSDSSSGIEDYERSRRRRRGSDSSCSESSSDEDRENLTKGRWKVDPIEIKFSKSENGKDIVKILLEKWTVEGKVNDGKKRDDEKDKKETNERKLKRAVVDVDSLTDDW